MCVSQPAIIWTQPCLPMCVLLWPKRRCQLPAAPASSELFASATIRFCFWNKVCKENNTKELILSGKSLGRRSFFKLGKPNVFALRRCQSALCLTCPPPRVLAHMPAWSAAPDHSGQDPASLTGTLVCVVEVCARASICSNRGTSSDSHL